MDLVRCIVLEIRPDRLARYREIVASIEAPLERKDEVIRSVASLLQVFIDKAFGVDPVQLAIRSKLVDSFQTAAIDANLGNRQDAARVDLITEGAITQTELDMDVRHDEFSKRNASDEGSHLLPRF